MCVGVSVCAFVFVVVYLHVSPAPLPPSLALDYVFLFPIPVRSDFADFPSRCPLQSGTFLSFATDGYHRVNPQ